jgi:ATP-dependent RNA helicase DOB1
VNAFEALPPQEKYIVDVLLNCAKGSTTTSKSGPAESAGAFKPCPPGQEGEPLVCPVLLSTVANISHLRVHLPKDLRALAQRETLWKVVLEIKRRFPKGLALLDPIENMNIKDVKFKELVEVSLSPSVNML